VSLRQAWAIQRDPVSKQKPKNPINPTKNNTKATDLFLCTGNSTLSSRSSGRMVSLESAKGPLGQREHQEGLMPLPILIRLRMGHCFSLDLSFPICSGFKHVAFLGPARRLWPMLNYDFLEVTPWVL
jgi:hypothetical protein